MEEILKEINKRYIKISSDEKSKNNDIVLKVLKEITEELKTDELFKFMYETNVFTGSYYKNLKIKNANEYDINFSLVLPKEISKISEVDTSLYPGSAQVKLDFRYISQDRELREKIKTKLCNDDYLDCSRVNNWFQSLIQKSVDQIKSNLKTCHNLDIKFHKCGPGPAKTLLINNEISIDLVPCFKFSRYDHELCNYKSTTIKEYLLVPKIAEKRIQWNPERYWRVSFPEEEKNLLSNSDNLKSAIRILKLIRDEQNHKSLSSYYIQTVGMHSLHSDRNSHRTLEGSFFKVLELLIGYLERKNIPFYWCDQFNLLSNYDDRKEVLENLKGFYSNFHKKIQKNPEKIYDYINSKSSTPTIAHKSETVTLCTLQ